MSYIKEIQAAQQALEAAETEAARVAALIAQREPVADEPAADAEKARQAYEDAAAAVALGDAPAETAAAAKAALSKIEQRAADAAAKRQQADALRAGLQRRAESSAAALEAAQARLQAAQIAWAQAELQAADQTYTEHALRLMPAVARVAALRGLLRTHNVTTAGPAIIEDSVVLQAIGPASAAAVVAAHPHLQHGWNVSLSRFDPVEARQAVEAELADIAAAPTGGIKAAIKRALAGGE